MKTNEIVVEGKVIVENKELSPPINTPAVNTGHQLHLEQNVPLPLNPWFPKTSVVIQEDEAGTTTKVFVNGSNEASLVVRDEMQVNIVGTRIGETENWGCGICSGVSMKQAINFLDALEESHISEKAAMIFFKKIADSKLSADTYCSFLQALADCRELAGINPLKPKWTVFTSAAF